MQLKCTRYSRDNFTLIHHFCAYVTFLMSYSKLQSRCVYEMITCLNSKEVHEKFNE